jgi:hypothetical protein
MDMETQSGGLYIYMHLESYKANTLVLSWKRSEKEGYRWRAWDLWATHTYMLDLVPLSPRYYFLTSELYRKCIKIIFFPTIYFT